MQQIDKENAIKLGKAIKAMREQMHLSLNSLTMNHAAITPATWSRIENGKTDIKFSSLLKVSAALNLPVNELLKGIDFNCSFED